MLILDLLGMYFDAAEVFFTNFSLFFILDTAMLWQGLLIEHQFKVRLECTNQLPDDVIP